MLSFLGSTDFLLWVVWAGLALLTVSLLVLMQTRWGRSRPLRKCVVLSVLAHLLLLGYAATIKIVTAGRGRTQDTRVQLADDEPDEQQKDPRTREPLDWERPQPAPTPVPTAEPLDRAAVDHVESPPIASTAGAAPTATAIDAGPNLATTSAAIAPTEIPVSETPVDAATSQAVSAAELAAPMATAMEAPASPQPQAQELAKPNVAPELAITANAPLEAPRSSLAEEPSSPPQLENAPTAPSPEDIAHSDMPLRETPEPLATETLSGAVSNTVKLLNSDPRLKLERSAAAAVTAASRSAESLPPGMSSEASPPMPSELQPRQVIAHHVPEIYRLRVQPNREELVSTRGGNAATQTAVRLALRWLATHQSDDGRWNAALYGAGQERQVAGHNREGAGAKADTGITGLALLAFLGDGHTHLDGPYRQVVQSGLDFLIRSQARDGSLSGDAETFSAMYCHGMAAFALAEAYGMTGDPRLEVPVKKAVAYTLLAQHPTQGGWRYRPGDAFGDTSQLGWQLMALKSAELAGVEVPQAARDGMIRFLKSVSHGKRGGLASYRAGEQSNRVMTAEALFCRQLLGMTRANPASDEAGDYLLQELPGQQINLYYWYYGTLAMYQLQDKHWETWNEALQKVLLERQLQFGADQGSWDPDCIWGGYGGRVYSTALATLCLEVYYRFLPIYAQKAVPLRR